MEEYTASVCKEEEQCVLMLELRDIVVYETCILFL